MEGTETNDCRSEAAGALSRRQSVSRFGAKSGEPLPKILNLLGGDEEIRTPDLLSAIQALSQLSYVPTAKMPNLRGASPHPRRRGIANLLRKPT